MELSSLHDIADRERRSRAPIQIRCCIAAGCESADSLTVLSGLQRAVEREGLTGRVQVAGVGCMRLCSRGPLVQLEPDGQLYQRVGSRTAPSIVAGIKGGKVEAETCDPASPFFALQSSVVLENCGRIEPERIETYIAAGGYQSLHHVLHEMTPAQVIETITRSGLRGRGGAGYPTGVKWATVAKNPGQRKFVVCNADEGDPGAFMNRSVLESDPHRVLEGMAIAGYAIGANQGYIYVRGEYLLALKRLADGHPASGPPRLARRRHILHTVQLPHRPAARRRRLCLRRRDRDDGVDHGRSRHADAPAALPRRARPVGHADVAQQRGDVRQHRRHHPKRPRVVRRDRYAKESGHESLLRHRQGRQHGAGRGALGHFSADHRARHRRRHRRAAASRRFRQADRPAVASRPSCSTRRPTTSRCVPSARSWARAE